MANWCWNNVNFTGDELRIDEIRKLVHQMIDLERDTGHGQLPDFAAAENGGWFFETTWDDGGPLTYQTKWAPNTVRLVEIADHYGVGFIHNYEEPGMQIYGEATYENGRLTEIDLDDQDFEQYDYDEEKDRYTFENEEYDGDWEILETLLDRKKADYSAATQPKR